MILQDGVLHESSRRMADGVIETSPACWEYALRLKLPSALRTTAPGALVVTIDVRVVDGRIGIGCLDAAKTAFRVERFVDASPDVRRVTLRVGAADVSAVIVRNASDGGPSRFAVLRAEARRVPEEAGSYPVQVAPRDYESERVPHAGDAVFDDEAADAINAARMAFIRRLALPLQGRRVLDAGAGVGHFAQLYAGLGATVVAVEGRADNVRILRQRYPGIEAHVGDIQHMDLSALGTFDIVHCFGLLYHLDSPVAALRRIGQVCSDVLLLETMVCDAVAPVMVLADETKSANQALAGLGSRPSPAFVVMALNRVGFPWVYGASSPPDHPDFHFEWKNDSATSRAGRNLRCIFAASRRELDSEVLAPLIEP